MNRVVLLLVCAMLVGAQTTDAMSWKLVDKPLALSKDKKFSVELPVGWVRAIDDKNVISATRDGMGIQLISTVRTKHRDAFKQFETKKQKKANAKRLPNQKKAMVNAQMLPAELAELVIADLKSGSEMSHVRVVSNLPLIIDGHQGFQLHFQYKNKKGLQFDHMISGFVDEKNLYQFAYRAPSKIYFPRDLKAFDKMVASFKLEGGKFNKKDLALSK